MSKKTVLIPLMLLVTVAAILTVGKISADNQAATFTKKNASEQLTPLRAASATLAFSDKIIVGREETDAELAGIKGQCDKQDAFIKQATEAAKSNVIASNPFGFLSAKYQDAKTSTANNKLAAVKADVTTLSKACKSYMETVTIGKNNNKFTEQKKALVVTGAEARCADAQTTGCLPTSNFVEYRKYFQEEITLAKDYKEHYANNCVFPELKKVCSLYGDYYAQRLTLNKAYDKALGGGVDVTAESNALRALVFPKDAICNEVRAVADIGADQASCATRGAQVLATKYEAKIVAELAK